MAIQQSTTASNSILTRYETAYRDGVAYAITYDDLAGPLKKTFEPAGSTVTVQWMSKAQPRPTTAIGSEVADFDPQTVTDMTASVTLTYYADGINTMVPYKPALKSANPAMGTLRKSTWTPKETERAGRAGSAYATVRSAGN